MPRGPAGLCALPVMREAAALPFSVSRKVAAGNFMLLSMQAASFKPVGGVRTHLSGSRTVGGWRR